jgi:hypothetical protein
MSKTKLYRSVNPSRPISALVDARPPMLTTTATKVLPALDQKLLAVPLAALAVSADQNHLVLHPLDGLGARKMCPASPTRKTHLACRTGVCFITGS